MNITKNSLKTFRTDFAEAVSSLEEKYGITINVGNISFDKNEFSTRLTVINAATPEEAEKLAFESVVPQFAHMGFSAEMYGQSYKGHDGNEYRLTGLNVKARKNFCTIERAGTKYSCAPGFIGLGNMTAK